MTKKCLEGGWAVGDAAERKLRELEQLEALFSEIIKEYLVQGEELMQKVRKSGSQIEEKDVFGFEIREQVDF